MSSTRSGANCTLSGIGWTLSRTHCIPSRTHSMWNGTNSYRTLAICTLSGTHFTWRATHCILSAVSSPCREMKCPAPRIRRSSARVIRGRPAIHAATATLPDATRTAKAMRTFAVCSSADTFEVANRSTTSCMLAWFTQMSSARWQVLACPCLFVREVESTVLTEADADARRRRSPVSLPRLNTLWTNSPIIG